MNGTAAVRSTSNAQKMLMRGAVEYNARAAAVDADARWAHADVDAAWYRRAPSSIIYHPSSTLHHPSSNPCSSNRDTPLDAFG